MIAFVPSFVTAHLPGSRCGTQTVVLQTRHL